MRMAGIAMHACITLLVPHGIPGLCSMRTAVAAMPLPVYRRRQPPPHFTL